MGIGMIPCYLQSWVSVCELGHTSLRTCVSSKRCTTMTARVSEGSNKLCRLVQETSQSFRGSDRTRRTCAGYLAKGVFIAKRSHGRGAIAVLAGSGMFSDILGGSSEPSLLGPQQARKRTHAYSTVGHVDPHRHRTTQGALRLNGG